MTEEVKGALRSRINISGILVILCSMITDPLFKTTFDFIPTEWITRITFLAGFAIVYFRSNSTPNVPVVWTDPLAKVKTNG